MKLNEKKVNKIKTLLNKGYPYRKLSKSFKVHHSTIADIKHELTWNPKRRLITNKSKVKKMQGENAPSAKLTEKKVLKIRLYLKKGNYTQAYLAEKYGVTNQLISLIHTKKIWKHI
jgi:transposase